MTSKRYRNVGCIEWDRVRLAEFIQFKNGKKRPVGSGDIPVYGGNGILDFCDKSNNHNIVIIGRVGAYCGSVYYEKDACWVSDNAISANNKLNSDICFIYYLLKNLNLNSRHIGTSQPLLTQEILNNIEFYLPPITEQKAIAAALSCLDDKIETNNRINKNLEAQAQAIFKSWFVDFEPFQDDEFSDSELGEIPKGWKVVTLSGVCSLIARGITPKYTENSDQIILNQKCIREHQVSLVPSRYHIPKKVNEKWLQYGDILVNSTGQGTLGRTAQWYQEELNITVDSHVTIVRPQEPNMIYYIGQFIMGKEYEIESMASGSTGQTELSRERLGSLKVIMPPSKQLEDFSAIVEPFMKQITINNKETLQLAKLRDTLLPKLMSGEIQIPQEV